MYEPTEHQALCAFADSSPAGHTEASDGCPGASVLCGLLLLFSHPDPRLGCTLHSGIPTPHSGFIGALVSSGWSFLHDTRVILLLMVTTWQSRAPTPGEGSLRRLTRLPEDTPCPEGKRVKEGVPHSPVR